MWHWSGSNQTFGDKFSGAEAQVWTLDSIFPFVWSHDNKVNNNLKCISTSSVLYYGVCVYRWESAHLFCLFPVSVLHCAVLRSEVLFNVYPHHPGQDSEHAAPAQARVLLLAPVSRIPTLKVVTLLEIAQCVRGFMLSTFISVTLLILWVTEKWMYLQRWEAVKISPLRRKKYLVYCFHVTSASRPLSLIFVSECAAVPGCERKEGFPVPLFSVIVSWWCWRWCYNRLQNQTIINLGLT